MAKANRKFEQLEKLYPYMIPTKEKRTRQILDMFWLDIALALESGGDLPTTVFKYVERAYRAEHRLS